MNQITRSPEAIFGANGSRLTAAARSIWELAGFTLARLRAGDPVRASAMDATLVTGLLLAAIYVGSVGLKHFDHALAGYCAATIVACFAASFRVSLFWRRGPSAFYGRVLLRGLREPRTLMPLLTAARRNLGTQSFIAPRSRVRWAAHMLLSWGTLSAFAVTFPLVWGWLHFESPAPNRYRAIFWFIPVASFDIHGVIAWLAFNALNLSAVAVILGAGYFLVLRLRQRDATTRQAFHIAPIVLLLVVAITGLGLTFTAHLENRIYFRLTLISHEIAVCTLLLSFAYGKLIHLFIRPLQLGAQLLRATCTTPLRCESCARELAPPAQLEAVENLLRSKGFKFNRHQRLCPPCRRRQVASVQCAMLEGRFQALG